jgi:hypothetical protein
MSARPNAWASIAGGLLAGLSPNTAAPKTVRPPIQQAAAQFFGGYGGRAARPAKLRNPE